MKLYKAFTIFYPRRYRTVLAAVLIVFFLLNVIVPMTEWADLRSMFASLMLSLISLVILYGDMEVFAGIYNREGGQIAGVQASFYGERVLSLGILADRLASFIWLFLMGFIWFLWGEAFAPLNWGSFLTGLGIAYTVVTIGVNINRFFLVTQAVMFACVIEAGIAGIALVLLWLVFPAGNWCSAVVSLVCSAIVTYITIKIAAHYAKRSYYDV